VNAGLDLLLLIWLVEHLSIESIVSVLVTIGHRLLSEVPSSRLVQLLLLLFLLGVVLFELLVLFPILNGLIVIRGRVVGDEAAVDQIRNHNISDLVQLLVFLPQLSELLSLLLHLLLHLVMLFQLGLNATGFCLFCFLGLSDLFLSPSPFCP